MTTETGAAAPLDPGTLPPPRTELIRDATVMPMGPGRDMPHGVFRADGSFCDASRTLISKNRFTGIPPAPGEAGTLPLRGRYLFAGVGRHHFGHFLMEGLGRLWALEQTGEAIEGILIVPMHDKDIESVLRRRFLPFYSWLCDARPLWLIDRPARVDEVSVPTQGFGHGDWSVGTPEFRRFICDRIAARITPEGPRRIFVSRTQLKSAEQRMYGEERLERALIKRGYVAFHPEQYSIAEQLQVYMAAERIVGVDGSAFHLAPFAMRPGARVGLIQRRHRRAPFDALCAQIRAFAEVDLVTLDALTSPEDLREGAAPVDIRRLVRRLGDAGFF
ncbi:glycosyltransferase family 61 protein [Roseovarius sp. SCSIO 43702]|uniref:glycosyltransferase family 61 protein n=1 Tax=Roseovarius sp. SCSIO 43702 TaxID=2823043 RepID=UPI001C7308A2|nr:glycosyltransferase family 61 protein [Roseovarius sp. SCSIO 43702]QYX56624.1 glycosyltransferase family 61 protein [Roseovarius sp. SCSIO 43702]